MRRMPNELRYTFTVTPIAPYDIWVRIQRNRLTDEAGNQNGQIDGPYIRYVAPANKPPVADAGPDQTVVSGATVTLDGSGSDDPNGSIKSYEWFQAGAGVHPPLTNGNTARPTFTAPTVEPGAANVILTYGLRVTDDDNEVSTVANTVRITVTPPPAANKPPVADAGLDQTVASDATVELDGSGSRDDDGTITYAWERTDGTSTASVPLSSATAIKPTFTADTLAAGAADVTHIFTLTVTDDDGDRDTDTVTITVTSPFAPVVARAGDDQEVASGELVRASCVFLDSGFYFILTRDSLFFKQAKVVSMGKMGKAHPMELRQRVVSHVDAGNTHRSAAARFDVSVKFVNDMVKLKQETGSLAPKRQGNPGIGKLTPHESWVREQVKAGLSRLMLKLA